MEQKYIRFNTRGQKSSIDYIITNRNVHPSQILDVRSLTSADLSSDYRLVLRKIKIAIQKNRKEIGNEIKIQHRII